MQPLLPLDFGGVTHDLVHLGSFSAGAHQEDGLVICSHFSHHQVTEPDYGSLDRSHNIQIIKNDKGSTSHTTHKYRSQHNRSHNTLVQVTAQVTAQATQHTSTGHTTH